MSAHTGLLRESSRSQATGLDVRVVIGESDDADGGLPDGAALRRFAMAVLGDSADELAAARAALVDAVGPERAGQAARIVASFDGINRVADATGIRLDAEVEASAGDLIEELRFAEVRTD
ncbi:MAG: hypothetical protein QNK03_09095 [Myxococcota bacterium]|nr:hypothetical protein [Myxococcota bacterium]